MNIGINALQTTPEKHTISLSDGCRAFIIGDLDGDLSALKNELTNVNFDSESDSLFCLGDTIDRGCENYELFEYLKRIKAFMVLGNHEHLMLESLLSKDTSALDIWTHNGGRWHSKIPHWQLKDMCDELQKKPLSILLKYKTYKVGLSHTFPSTWDWEDYPQEKSKIVESLLWDRDVFKNKKVVNNQGVHFSIHGHNSTRFPLWVGNSFHIDTNYYLGKPTLIELSSIINQFEQQ